MTRVYSLKKGELLFVVDHERKPPTWVCSRFLTEGARGETPEEVARDLESLAVMIRDAGGVPCPPDWRDWYTQVARALGIIYETDGRAPEPGPINVVLHVIADLQRAREANLEASLEGSIDRG